MEKVNRNDPCPCGSGKKYKKCCELKTGLKKFSAQVITGSTQQPGKLTSFFQNRVVTPVKPPEPPKEESK